MKAKGKTFVGCSGFSYAHWKGVFYPKEIAPNKWLEFYAQRFNTVELNVTFYRLPKQSVFKSWQKRTPKGFIFVVKGSKLITHFKMLKQVKEPLKELIERVSGLGEKLGLMLWQLKPSQKLDWLLLAEFVELLKESSPKLRHSFEFRNSSWFVPEVYKLLSDARMTVCLADYPARLPEPSDDFPYIYIRRHGPESSAYRGCYSQEQLKALAERIKNWLNQGKDVYVYFNNDLQGYAPENALQLKKYLG